MRQTGYPLPLRGGIYYCYLSTCISHCVLLSALTYALSPTPQLLITHDIHITHTQGSYVQVPDGARHGDAAIGGGAGAGKRRLAWERTAGAGGTGAGMCLY